jgi:hypothetical protein
MFKSDNINFKDPDIIAVSKPKSNPAIVAKKATHKMYAMRYWPI